MDLTGKIALVTGASSGIGLAIGRALAEKGSYVYGLARSKDRLHEIASEIGELFTPVECDVRDVDSVETALQVALRDHGRIDILVNNAGLGVFGPVDQLKLEDWDVQIDTNITGVFLMTRAVVPHMKKQNAATGFGGHVVNIASIAGLLGNPNMSAYNATKFAVRGFSEALMKEVREDGIKVTCVYPGSVDTSFSTGRDFSLSPNAMTADEVAGTIMHILETRDNYLISEIVLRPLRPKG